MRTQIRRFLVQPIFFFLALTVFIGLDLSSAELPIGGFTTVYHGCSNPQNIVNLVVRGPSASVSRNFFVSRDFSLAMSAASGSGQILKYNVPNELVGSILGEERPYSGMYGTDTTEFVVKQDQFKALHNYLDPQCKSPAGRAALKSGGKWGSGFGSPSGRGFASTFGSPTRKSISTNPSAPPASTGTCANMTGKIGPSIGAGAVSVGTGILVGWAADSALSKVIPDPIQRGVTLTLAGPVIGELTGLGGAALGMPGFGATSLYFGSSAAVGSSGIIGAGAAAVSTPLIVAQLTSEQMLSSAQRANEAGDYGAVAEYTDFVEEATSYGGLGVFKIAAADWWESAWATGPLSEDTPGHRIINPVANTFNNFTYWCGQVWGD